MHRRIIFLLVLSLIPFAAWSAPKAQAPSHRGPMTKAELRQVYRNFRKGPDKALRAAAKRVLRADKEGRPYRGRKYEVVETMPGELVTIKERGKKLDERSHAKLELDTGAVVVHGRAYRQEQGKSTRSQISLSVWGGWFSFGESADEYPTGGDKYSRISRISKQPDARHGPPQHSSLYDHEWLDRDDVPGSRRKL